MTTLQTPWGLTLLLLREERAQTWPEPMPFATNARCQNSLEKSPCLTRERMSPLLMVLRSLVSPAGVPLRQPHRATFGFYPVPKLPPRARSQLPPRMAQRRRLHHRFCFHLPGLLRGRRLPHGSFRQGSPLQVLAPIPRRTRHRPVAWPHPPCFPAQPCIPVPGRGARHVHRTGGGPRKLPVERPQMLPGQKTVRAFQVADPGPPQRFDQPVLQHAVHPFHPPLGLRAVGQVRSTPNAAIARPNCVCGSLPARCSARLATPSQPTDAGPVHRQAARPAVFAHPARQHIVAGPGGLLRAEPRPHLVGRVVHHHHQHAPGAAAFEPLVGRPVQLHHRPEARLAFPPLPVRLLPPPHRGFACRQRRNVS